MRSLPPRNPVSPACKSAASVFPSSAAISIPLRPGESATIDNSDLGSPLAHLSDIPAGDYYVQAMINVYSEFHRADGHTVWMHDDQWEGQRWQRSPGNLYSKAVKMHIDPASGISA